MKWHISVDHRLIGATDVYDTSGDVELIKDDDIGHAITEFVHRGLRHGHEITAVRCYRVDVVEGC